MIRIDEIYQNIFVPWAKSQPGTGLHWFDPFGSTDINHLCNLPFVADEDATKRIVFWDQEPLYPEQSKKFFDCFLEIYDNCEISIVTSEKSSLDVENISKQYGLMSHYYFFHAWAALDWYRGYDKTFLYRPFLERDIHYTFLCLNNIIGGRRKHRVLLFKELVDKNLISQNLVSFPEICPYEKQTIHDICKTHGIELDTNKVSLPLRVDEYSGYENRSSQIDLWNLGDQSLLQVVTETLFFGNKLHLTEKTFKPIVMQQPFIIVSCQGSLEYLRSYGFRTFDDFWDESYDCLDDHSRISAISQLLQDIDQLSKKEKTHLQKHLADAVEYNFRWFYSREFEDLLWQELTAMRSLL